MRDAKQKSKEAGARGADMDLRSILFNAAASLFPGYFALVMATGVVSIACEFLGLRFIALVLFAVNWAAYPVLWALTILRAWQFPAALLKDISNHQRAPGYLTIVAGTCVLGTQGIVVLGATGLGTALWWVGMVLWFVIMYTFFTAVTVRHDKPTLAKGINASWLIAAVATQSVVVLRGAIDSAAPPPEMIQFQVIAMFMIGCLLYLAVIPLIFYRLTFAPFSSKDFSPPYWINMGAVAITTLAGSILISRGETWPLLEPLLPFLRGFTFFFWAAASWWIPFLFALTVWRYVWMHDQFTYEPRVWGMVFPLGMYTTSTYEFGRAMGYGFLGPIAHILLFAALAAWLLGMAGLVRQIWKSFSKRFV